MTDELTSASFVIRVKDMIDVVALSLHFWEKKKTNCDAHGRVGE
jgi:hypothetical protein